MFDPQGVFGAETAETNGSVLGWSVQETYPDHLPVSKFRSFFTAGELLSLYVGFKSGLNITVKKPG